jgi:hypothetical protein
VSLDERPDAADPGLVPMHTLVSLTARQKRALGRDLRDAVFRLCSAAGVLLGLLWDLSHSSARGRPLSGACRAHAAGHAAMGMLARCIGSELSSVILAWLIPVGVGLLLGALVGVLLASMIRLGRSLGQR